MATAKRTTAAAQTQHTRAQRTTAAAQTQRTHTQRTTAAAQTQRTRMSAAASAAGTRRRSAGTAGPTLVESRRQPKIKAYIDFTLLLLILLLLAFGFVMLYSASSYVSNLKFGDSFYYLKRQMFAAALGGAGMVAMAIIPYAFWKRLSPYIYLTAFLLSVFVLVAGRGHNGSVRWIQIGPINFQPSELAKLAVIIFVAAIISGGAKSLRDFRSVVKVLFLVLLTAVPVGLANLSTAIIIVGIAVIMLYVAFPRTREFFWMAVAGGILLLAVVLLRGGYRMGRIQTWLHPTYQDAYQTLQGLYAIGSGGLFGKGLGESMQKSFVPEAHNDMIFSIICEELGLFGALCLILLFLVLIWRLVMIAVHCKDMFGSFLVIGILSHIALQFILNIAVVTNSIPNTGVTLPFVSYGSTALLVTMTEMGLALSVSKNTYSTLDGIDEESA